MIQNACVRKWSKLQLQHSRTLDSVLVTLFSGSPVDNLPDTIDVGCFVVEVLLH